MNTHSCARITILAALSGLALSGCGPIAPSVSKSSLSGARAEVQPGNKPDVQATCAMEPVIQIFQYERRISFVSPDTQDASIERHVPEKGGDKNKDAKKPQVVRVEGKTLAATSRDKAKAWQVDVTFEKNMPSRVELRFEINKPAEGAENPAAADEERFRDEFVTRLQPSGDRKFTLTIPYNPTSDWVMENLSAVSIVRKD